jgi:hypothetical protein
MLLTNPQQGLVGFARNDTARSIMRLFQMPSQGIRLFAQVSLQRSMSGRLSSGQVKLLDRHSGVAYHLNQFRRREHANVAAPAENPPFDFLQAGELKLQND